MLSKVSLENPGNWYKHVGRVEQLINNIEPRSTKVLPFKLLTDVDMRVVDSSELKDQVQQTLIQELGEYRKQMRQEVREQANFQSEEKGRNAVQGQRSSCNQTHSV